MPTDIAKIMSYKQWPDSILSITGWVSGRLGEWVDTVCPMVYKGHGFLGLCKPLPISHSLWITILKSTVIVRHRSQHGLLLIKPICLSSLDYLKADRNCSRIVYTCEESTTVFILSENIPSSQGAMTNEQIRRTEEIALEVITKNPQVYAKEAPLPLAKGVQGLRACLDEVRNEGDVGEGRRETTGLCQEVKGLSVLATGLGR